MKSVKNLNRDELQYELAQRIVDSMDMDTLLQYAMDNLIRAYDGLTNAELENEIMEFAEDLLAE